VALWRRVWYRRPTAAQRGAGLIQDLQARRRCDVADPKKLFWQNYASNRLCNQFDETSGSEWQPYLRVQAMEGAGISKTAYTGIGQAFAKIYREEGVLAFWWGAVQVDSSYETLTHSLRELMLESAWLRNPTLEHMKRKPGFTPLLSQMHLVPLRCGRATG
jgi:hypothetical protein